MAPVMRSCQWLQLLNTYGRLVVFTLALTTTARGATFEWHAPAGCPERDAIRWRVEEALGTSLDHAAPLLFVAHVEQKSKDNWVVTLDVSSSESAAAAGSESKPSTYGAASTGAVQPRVIEATNCSDLAQATSVAIALALGANLKDHDSEEAPASPPAQPAAPAATTAVKPPEAANRTAYAATKKAEAPRPAPWLSAALNGVLDHGALPGWAPGVDGALALGRGAFSARFGLLVLPSETKYVSGSAGGAFSLWAATAAVCGHVDRGSARLRLCAGAEWGKLSGKGVNVSLPMTGSSTWFAPRGDLDLSLPLGDASFRGVARGSLLSPRIRKNFAVEPLGSVHQPSSIDGRLSLGLELIWP